jgi:hypothetical protein
MSDRPITPQKRTPEADAEERATTIASNEFGASAFDDFMRKMSGSAKEGTAPKSWRYRELTLTIPPEAFRPDTFDAAIRLTLRELDQAAELRAYRALGMQNEDNSVGTVNGPDTEDDDDEAAKDDPQARGTLMAIVFAREALHAVNGRPFRDQYEKRVFWNALTMGGRLAVGQEFLAAGAGLDTDAMGKISKSVVVS